MGRELLLPQKKGYNSKQRTQHELSIVCRLLSCFESFETFMASNEVFDIFENRPIVHTDKLKILFNDGLTNSNRYHVISKN